MPAVPTPLDDFHPLVRSWFSRTFTDATPPQVLGWPPISRGEHTLILAPTGSGKTLAAFLWAINHLLEQHLRERLAPGVRILYVSPLKALNNDIERNLQDPLAGIQTEARRQRVQAPEISVAVRTGDTPAARRAAMIRRPPEILITTPESLYLMLTGESSRRMFESVQYVIIDEIHSVCGTKRGVHLSLSLERLQRIARQEFVRIGLSATLRPLERVARFLGGQMREDGRLLPRPVTIVDAGRKREMDLQIQCPVEDFSLLPQEGVWPSVFDELLGLIRAHTTTLVFVNNRRLAERVATTLNERLGSSEAPAAVGLYAVPRPTSPDEALPTLSSEPTPHRVQAYHGSMSREAREEMETDLKAGRLRALVATSALELGIDIGSIDLVVQLQSPKGVASGLQRVGRSGHLVRATSKGRIIATHREDLLECAVIGRAMKRHEVEETRVPENCLDVLAQQIVAMVSVEPWGEDELFQTIGGSYCYRDLPRPLFTGVLQMLAGRYEQESLRALQPRISWDRVNHRLHPLPGSRRLAVLSGGTITDKGQYGVYLEDGKTKVGEVDEEFVYETRVGDTFLLGSSVWEVTAMDANRLTVRGAPGQPARMPFWRGEGLGRGVETGRRLGEFRRALAERLDSDDALAWLQREFPIDGRGAWNILQYFRRQRSVAGVIPHDRLILVEGFRDEIGDPRIAVHSAFGRKVNTLLGLLLGRTLLERSGITPQTFTNDDGILLRSSEADSLPLDLLEHVSPELAQTVVTEDLLMAPVFGGQFRQNAIRALLMPKAAPGKRTPLWLQRLRAKDLLEIARQFSDFPIVIETVRELLNDVLDYGAFAHILHGITEGSIEVRTVQTEVPSPFSASLLFDFMAVYMYEWDQPRADRLSRFATINRELLSEVVDLDTIRSMIRPEAVEHVERRLQHRETGTRARSPEELMELLLRLGDLTEAEIIERCEGDARAMLDVLAADGRAVCVQVAGEPRWVAGEEVLLYGGEEHVDRLAKLLQRYLEHRGPVAPEEFRRRYGVSRARTDRAAERLFEAGRVVSGHFLPQAPSQDEPHWAYRPNLERIQRQTLTILRREISPVPLGSFSLFLQRWQKLRTAEGQQVRGESLREVLAQLQGLPLPAEIWERDLLRSRLERLDREQLDRETLSGSVVFTGSGPGRLMVLVRGLGSVFLSAPSPEPSDLSQAAGPIASYLSKNGASFFGDIREGTGLSLRALNAGLAELFWAGMLTNDRFSELSGIRRPARLLEGEPLEPVRPAFPGRHPSRQRMIQSVRRALRQVPGWSGRWSLVRTSGVLGKERTLEEQIAGQAAQLLERYGIVARELVRRETLLPWSLLAPELQRMELRGEIRRGYFVTGLAGMQYALPEAVESLRQHTGGAPLPDGFLFLNACDPASPYGPGINPPIEMRSAIRILRAPANYLVTSMGVPTVWIEAYGSRIWTLGEGADQAFRAGVGGLQDLLTAVPEAKPLRLLTVELIDGERATESRYGAILREAGFRRGPGQSLVWDGYR